MLLDSHRVMYWFALCHGMFVKCVDEEYLYFYPGSGQDEKDVIGPCGGLSQDAIFFLL